MKPGNHLGNVWEIYTSEFNGSVWFCVALVAFLELVAHFVVVKTSPAETSNETLGDSIIYIWGVVLSKSKKYISKK